MRIGALVEQTVFGVMWLLWKGGEVLGLSDGGRGFGPGTPMVMPDEFADRGQPRLRGIDHR